MYLLPTDREEQAEGEQRPSETTKKPSKTIDGPSSSATGSQQHDSPNQATPLKFEYGSFTILNYIERGSFGKVRVVFIPLLAFRYPLSPYNLPGVSCAQKWRS